MQINFGGPAWVTSAREDVQWLDVRCPPSRLLVAVGDGLGRTGRGLARIVLGFVVGSLGSALISEAALGPGGTAHASVEDFLTTPPPPIAVEIPAQPIFAKSREERGSEDRAMHRARQREQAVDDSLKFGSRELPGRLVRTIVEAAEKTGVDPIYLMALADKESSFRTEIRASTSSAEGLFQFIDRTWLEMVRDYGGRYGLEMEADAIEIVDGKPVVADEAMRSRILELRREPHTAALMAAEMLKRDAAVIGFRIGRQLNTTELYLAHFLGLEDAGRFLELHGQRRPVSAVGAFPAAARANVGIFYESHRRKRRGLSIPEVYAKINGMIDSRVERYREVSHYASAEPKS